jgi:hypothetical protein
VTSLPHQTCMTVVDIYEDLCQDGDVKWRRFHKRLIMQRLPDMFWGHRPVGTGDMECMPELRRRTRHAEFSTPESLQAYQILL